MTNSQPRNRQSHRLNGYDYSLAGAYFVTIVNAQRTCLFGEVVNGSIERSNYGNIAFEQWVRLKKRFSNCSFYPFVIMPSHVHGVIYLGRGGGEEFELETIGISPLHPCRILDVVSNSLGALVRAYKSSVSFRFNKLPGYVNHPVWQRNYYDHIIRTEKDYQTIWHYIDSNPMSCIEDRFCPNA